MNKIQLLFRLISEFFAKRKSETILILLLFLTILTMSGIVTYFYHSNTQTKKFEKTIENLEKQNKRKQIQLNKEITQMQKQNKDLQIEVSELASNLEKAIEGPASTNEAGFELLEKISG